MGKIGASILQGVRSLFGKSTANQDPVNNDVITFNSTTQEWELISGIVGNAVQSSSNVGSGDGLALPRVLDDLPFKTLVDGVEIVITVSATELTFSIGAIAISKITGLQVELDSKLESPIAISDTTGLQLALDSKLESPIAISDVTNLQTELDSKLESPIAISDTTGLQLALDTKIETITNVGGEKELIKSKVSQDVPVRTLKEGSNISIIQNADDLEISATIPPTTGFRLIFNEKRQFSFYHSSGNIPEAIMLTSQIFNITGSGALPTIDIDGYYVEYGTQAMSAGDSGINGLNAVRRDLNIDIIFKFRFEDSTFRRGWIGFFFSDPMASDVNATNIHFALRFSSSAGNTNFVISHSDGVTQAETQIAVADTDVIHTIRLVSDESGSRWRASFDGGAFIDFTTNIPIGTDLLDLFMQVRSLESVSKDLDIWWIDGTCDA